MTEGIRDKIVVVTGASSGLGEATARLLSAKGATVVLGARRADRLRALARDLEARGGKALALETDVTSRQQVNALVDSAVQTYGRVDVMINNAGLMPQAPLEQLRVDEWDRMIDVNQGRALRNRRCIAAYAAPESRSFHQRILGRRPSGRHGIRRLCGHEIRSASAVRRATPGGEAYNIRTTVISPGAVATELPNSITDPSAAERVRAFYGQVAVPADSFARVVAFAMSQPQEVDINEILYRPTRQEL